MSLDNWRRQMREGRLAAPAPMSFVPVRLMDAAQPMPAASVRAEHPAAADTVEVLLSGGCCVRFGNGVSRPLLREVIAVVRR